MQSVKICLGTLYGEKGEFKKALNHFEAALDFLKESDDIIYSGNDTYKSWYHLHYIW